MGGHGPSGVEGAHGGARHERAGGTPAVALLAPDAAMRVAESIGVLGPLAELNVFRLLLRRPRLAKGTADLLLSILARAELPPALRELVIMRVAWVTRSAYEWAQHWQIALDVGVAEADLLGVRDWSAHRDFDAAQRCVLQAVDEVVESHQVSPPTVAMLVELLGVDAAIEAVAAIGAWVMVSIVLRSFDVPVEDGVALWPPEGAEPDDETVHENEERR